MTEFTSPVDLDFLQDGQKLSRLVARRFRARVSACRKVGQGYYAQIYKLSLDKAPRELIVKCHQYAGQGIREKEQLEVLGRHSLVKVPRVYGLHLPSVDLPCEALIMEYIPGINASLVRFPDSRSQERFVERVVENLRAWHGVSNAEGFGELGGPYHETWVEYFKKRITRYHRRIHRSWHRATVSGYVLGVVDRSFEALESILQGAHQGSSLVHGDYNAWNMLVDPRSYELVGIIDPFDAGWADYEIDLFHLANCRAELGLLEGYLKGREPGGGFRLRYQFYRFWDDIKHYLKVGWYEEERFRGYARALEAAMRECLS